MSIEEDLPISFRINGSVYEITFSQDDIELYNNLIDNNEFTLDYLNTLIESEELSLNEEVEEIYRINPNDDVAVKIFPEQYTNIVENKDRWNGPETRLLLENYEIYINEVGQSKLYRNKKCMWGQIADDINKKFKMRKTALQVENRFKTLFRRKEYGAKYGRTDKEDNNFKDKLTRLSLERPPKRKYRKCNSICDSPPDKGERSLQETLEHIHSEEEAAEERRHRETLILLKKHETAKERRRLEGLQMYAELLKNKLKLTENNN